MSPKECKSMTDLCSMDSTHKSVGRFDMLLQHDQAIILTEHPSGEKCRTQIIIPKRVFLKFMEWYEENQKS